MGIFTHIDFGFGQFNYFADLSKKINPAHLNPDLLIAKPFNTSKKSTQIIIYLPWFNELTTWDFQQEVGIPLILIGIWQIHLVQYNHLIIHWYRYLIYNTSFSFQNPMSLSIMLT